MKDILIAWIAGSGKGTQARALEKELGNNIQYFEPWSVLRAFTSSDNIIGDYAKAYTSTGKLLPDAFMASVLWLVFSSLQPWRQLLIDGFPRMYSQKHMFDQTMLDHKRDFIVFHLDLSEEEAMNRLEHRKICATCGTTYSTILESSITHCHDDNTLLTTRVDDQSPDAIKERFSLYHTETKPLLADYEKEGKLVRIDGSQSIEAITVAILNNIW